MPDGHASTLRTMPATVIVGAQWGDEGKGKIVDVLAERYAVVARYQGGSNAGHTVYVGDEEFKFRLLPSGILHEGAVCILGGGVVVEPQVLCSELDELEARAARPPACASRATPTWSCPGTASSTRPPSSGSATCRSARPGAASARRTPTRPRASGSGSRTCSTRRSCARRSRPRSS